MNHEVSIMTGYFKYLNKMKMLVFGHFGGKRFGHFGNLYHPKCPKRLPPKCPKTEHLHFIQVFKVASHNTHLMAHPVTLLAKLFS